MTSVRLCALGIAVLLSACGVTSTGSKDGGAGTAGGGGTAGGSGGAGGSGKTDGGGGTSDGGGAGGSGGASGGKDAAATDARSDGTATDAGADRTGDAGGGACLGLNASQCMARSECEVGTCQSCTTGAPAFVACYDPKKEGPPPCPGACPTTCTQATTLAECEAHSDCHSVFIDPGTCLCAALGCCARFSYCAAGDRALCNPGTQVLCDAAVPHCEGPYVVAYTATCYEGCVQSKDCAP